MVILFAAKTKADEIFLLKIQFHVKLELPPKILALSEKIWKIINPIIET